jgi:hypothetical protein
LEREIAQLPSGIREKIIPIKIPKSIVEAQNPWEVENATRFYLITETLKLSNSEKFIFADLDEIPSVEQLGLARNIQMPEGYLNIQMRMSYRKANWMISDKLEPWVYPKLISRDFIEKSASLEEIRTLSGKNLGGEPGIHLSYLGMDPIQIRRKYASFSHTELDLPKFSDPKLLEICDRYQISHLGDFKSKCFGLLDYIQMDSFDPILQSIQISRPEWLATAKTRKNYFQRVYRSFITTIILSQKSIDNVNVRPPILMQCQFLVYLFRARISRMIKMSR